MDQLFIQAASNTRSTIAVHCGRDTRQVSHAEFSADVSNLCERLRCSGVRPRMRIGLLANNGYEWLVIDFALLRLDCVSVCFPVEYFRDASLPQLISEYELSLLFVDGSLAARELPAHCVSVASVAQRFELRPQSRAVPELEREDVFTVVFSSGTSGKLKKLIISKRGTRRLIEQLGARLFFRPSDRALAFLPLSIFQQRWMVYVAVHFGFHFGLTEPFRVINYLQTFRPTILGAPPIFYEHVYNKALALPALRQKQLRALGIALAYAPLPGALLRLLQKRVFKEFHAAFGGELRLMLVGAAPSKPGMLELFQLLGLPLYEGYGLTETGYLTLNLPGRARFGSVGKPLTQGMIELAADGEIIANVDAPLCLGYFGESESVNRATFLDAHRVATGDIGEFDRNGYLLLRGRKKEIIVTSGGYKVHPELIEREIESHSRVRRAVVVGGEPFSDLRAVISVAAPVAEVEAEINRRVVEINAHNPPALRLNKVVLTSVELNQENGFVNRNLKIDRARVRDHFIAELQS